MYIRGGANVFSGYVLKDEKLIFGSEEFQNSRLKKEDLEGAYGEFAFLQVSENLIELSADFFGLSQWYYYINGSVFAASNHFHLLLEVLSRSGEKLSMNIKRSRVDAITSGFMFGSSFTSEMDVEHCYLNLPYEKIIFANGEVRKETTELYHILTGQEKWNDDIYDECIRKAAQEITANTMAYFTHDRFQQIVIDLNGGFDSRIVFAAANNLPRRLRQKIRLRMRPNGSRDNTEKAAAVANLYDYGRVRYEDDDTSEVFEEAGKVNLAQVSRTLGSFSQSTDLYKARHTDEKTLQLSGNLGVSVLGFKRCRGELQYSLGDQRLLARLGNCYLWNEVRQLQEVFEDQKELINNSLEGYGCNDLFKKFHILYANYRSRFVCSSARNIEYSNLSVSPLQSKYALQAKWMYFNCFANNAVPDEKISMDLLTMLNPLLVTLPFSSNNDDVMPKEENLLWSVHVTAEPDLSMKPDTPLREAPDRSKLYRTKVAEYMDDMSMMEQMLLQIYDYAEEYRPICMGLYRVLQELKEKPEDLRSGHGREQIRKIYDVYYQMSLCKASEKDGSAEEIGRRPLPTIFERKNNKIIIESVYADGQKLKADIVDNGQKKCLWFQYSDNYKPEALNADAFLIYLMRYAMLHDRDIESRVPVHYELANSLNRLLIPSMQMADGRHARMKVIAPVLSADECHQAPGVATGLSCGVDSFYALLNHYRTGDKNLDVTHLFFFDMFHTDINHQWETFNYCQKVAAEMGFSLIKICTNVLKVLDMNWFPTHLWSLFAGVNSMQNIIGKYYLASSFHVTDITMDNPLWTDPAHYELLMIKALHHKDMELYTEGPVSRMDKTDFIADFPIVQKRLSVCWPRPYDSCGICPKCVRTLVDLDVLGKVDKFGEIFDLEHYKKNRDWYMAFARTEHDYGNIFFMASVEMMKSRGQGIKYTFEDKIADIIASQSDRIVSYFTQRNLRSVLFFGRKYEKYVDEIADILLQHDIRVYCYAKDENVTFPAKVRDRVAFLKLEQMSKMKRQEIDVMVLSSMTLNIKNYMGVFDRLGRGLRSSTHLSEIINIPFFEGKEVEVEMNKVI